jgi:hypothetical protein
MINTKPVYRHSNAWWYFLLALPTATGPTNTIIMEKQVYREKDRPELRRAMPQSKRPDIWSSLTSGSWIRGPEPVLTSDEIALYLFTICGGIWEIAPTRRGTSRLSVRAAPNSWVCAATTPVTWQQPHAVVPMVTRQEPWVSWQSTGRSRQPTRWPIDPWHWYGHGGKTLLVRQTAATAAATTLCCQLPACLRRQECVWRLLSSAT